MRVRVIEPYNDSRLNKDMTLNDEFTTTKSRGTVLIKAGYVEEVQDYEASPEVEQPRRGRRQS